MKFIKNSGLLIFIFSFAVFVLSLTFSNHVLTNELLNEKIPKKKYHREMIAQQAGDMLGKEYNNNIAFINALKPVLKKSKEALDKASGVDPSKGIWNAVNLPEGVSEGEYRMFGGDIDHYLFELTKYSATGLLPDRSSLFFLLSFILGSLGALMYLLPDLNLIPGIKNDHIYQSSATRGITFKSRMIFLGAAVLASILMGIFKYFLIGILTIVAGAFIVYRIYQTNKANDVSFVKSRPVTATQGMGWLGASVGIFLIAFYVALYFFPQYITNWTLMLDPVSKSLSGNAAGRWFLYGFLYTVVMLVMGTRMMIKYRHNRYQLVRTGSVLFFQTGFAFLLPEFLLKLNQPYMDFKNAWPLDYDYFFDYNINGMLGQGTEFAIAGWATSVGTMMFVWGIVLTLFVVPFFTYYFGKRWYCSWVCGCGGLAETLGDPYRQLSDKSLTAWKYERYIIHGVLLFAVIKTAMVIYTYTSGSSNILFFDSNNVRSWYGFFIGSMFSGIVGTGFYPLMGNRVWCRFGCPLAGLMGLVQRFKSRFRITTNGGQCISCGNCSTYCEMGIDVRAYAQRGQNIVRASCVGCGICAAVCPRGVLRLENGAVDIDNRTTALKTIHIKDGVFALEGNVIH
ncbi:MAG: 4Fe-4S dicluster domain-containing protein [Bacteroidota bacterium]